MSRLSAREVLQQLLAKARRVGAEAAYVTPGAPPTLRVRGALVRLPTTVFEPHHTEAVLKALLDARRREAFAAAAEIHLPLALGDLPAWPVKAWHHASGAPALMVSLVAPTLDEATLAPVRTALARHDRGLVLLASPSAALRDAALAALDCTCEGTLRDPARDGALLERALGAAAARTAVLAADADAAVALLERLAVDTMRRLALGGALRSVVVLHPLGSAGALDAIAVELLLDTPAAAAHIVQGDWSGLAETMTRQRSFGMQTLDQELLRLHRAGAIDADQLMAHARQPEAVRFELALHPAAPAPLPDPAPPAPHVDEAIVADEAFGLTFALRPVQGPAAAAAAARRPQPTAARKREAVQFRAYAPPWLAPGATSLVDVWAFLASQAGDVARLAHRGGETIQVGLRAGLPPSRGIVVGVRLQIAGVAVRPSVQSIVWDGEPASASFPVTVPEGAAEGPRTARARLSAAGVAIGDLHFVVHVAARRRGDDGARDAGGRTTLIRNAFASYAIEDRAEMLARVHGMKKIAPDVDVFVDAIGLRTGGRWQERIEHEIALRDRLFLFWSEHAAHSPWVDFEWRLAQRTKGVDAIDPVPLADPGRARPPPELAALHFDDAWVAWSAGARRLEALRQLLPP